MRASDYLTRLSTALQSISVASIDRFVNELVRVRRSGGCVYIIGNGGSASTASHMATDLGVGSHRCGAGIRAITLTDNSGVVTATGNDLGFEEVFAAQVELLGQAGDLLVVISASGNSPNLLAAVDVAKRQAMTVVGLTGFDGGKLVDVADISIHVNTAMGDYGPAEDAHLAVNHMVTEQLRATFASTADVRDLHG
jgi:D-sedoheptulose 7-phosphate isomerase